MRLLFIEIIDILLFCVVGAKSLGIDFSFLFLIFLLWSSEAPLIAKEKFCGEASNVD